MSNMSMPLDTSVNANTYVLMLNSVPRNTFFENRLNNGGMNYLNAWNNITQIADTQKQTALHSSLCQTQVCVSYT